ncbi:MAG: hypothetical protein PHS74_00500 [Lachnospiraceae bacterium]|nr:hypothetical protein [Lachnospiraceae bacterium]
MEENENMETEVMIEESEGTEKSSGMGTGLAMLIGSGLTLAAIAGGKKLKKVWDNRKIKKEKQAVVEDEFDDDFVDEEIEADENESK